MYSITKVRIINIIGAVLFVIYGILIGAVSTYILNGILVFVHIIYLVRDKNNGKRKG